MILLDESFGFVATAGILNVAISLMLGSCFKERFTGCLKGILTDWCLEAILGDFVEISQLMGIILLLNYLIEN